MGFNEFYISEKKTDITVPTKIEKAIVDVVNTGKCSYNWRKYEPVVQEVVSYLNLKGQASHIGADMDGSLNSFYSRVMEEMGRSTKSINKRPKTDLIVNADRISLKLDRGWIFSHELKDAEACLRYVLEKSKLKNELVLEIYELFQTIKSKQSKDLYSADSKIFKNALVTKFKKLFEKEYPYLKTNFIQAGLRGTFKFEETDKAVADKLMVVKFKSKNYSSEVAMRDSTKIKWEETKIYDLKQNMGYMRFLAEKSRVAFVIRKSGNLRFDINGLELDGTVLTEGIIDTLVDLLKQGYEKVKGQIEKIFKYITDLINKGIQYFMEFLGLEIGVEMDEEIDF